MDNVLVNWVKGVKNAGVKNKHIQNFETKKAQENIWGIINDLGSIFWENLEWMPDGKTLWKYIEKYNPIILSAYCDYSKLKQDNYQEKRKNIIKGKRKWLVKNINAKISKEAKIIQRIDKSRYSNVNNILIDDDIRNIKSWKLFGGIAIHHKNTNQSIKELKTIYNQ